MSKTTAIFNPSKASQRKPIVLMSMGAQIKGGHKYQVMTNKYIDPIVNISNCLPILVPTAYGAADIEQYLDMASGVYLTGAATNIDPTLYGQVNETPDKPMDHARDLFDFPLIRLALERGLPFFGVCRGMQELNVALGGNLHQKIYNQLGKLDHRENPDAEPDVQYADSHSVKPEPGSWYAEIMKVDRFEVNSLHGQAINVLGKGIEVAATADDGVIEAVHMPDRGVFTLGVQWHPEWKASQNPHSIAMFKAFGEACYARQAAINGI